jgi:hypothetical protein
LNSDNKRAPHDDDDDAESHAADEPTAVWDENALRAAGLSDLLRKRDSEPPAPPATVPAASGRTESSIVVDVNSIVPKETGSDRREASSSARDASSGPARIVTPLPQASPQLASEDGGLGWGATLGIAVALGAIVYGLIRFLKG